MMLEKNKIEDNKNLFISTLDKYNIFTDKLSEYLGDNLYIAPASNMLSLHNAFPGGLVDHILRVTKYANKLNNILPNENKVDQTSLMKVCFLHQIGKTFLYELCESEWHRKNLGKMYEFNEKITSMRVGERSLFYALNNGVNLSDLESQAILNFDKPEDDAQATWYTDDLGVILKAAVRLAIMEEKKIN